jgi:putative ABC transport system ATP-binding protein
LLTLDGVTKTYESGQLQVTAVRNVDLEVRKSDFILIAGRSGSGKTTLLSLLGGLAKPTSGHIVLEGTDIWTR